ncbi:MAG: TonB family protein [Betaproteobacteria bacterium]|nr:MAG: TonB family protein [Betaproteobacteria bacterium]
MSFPPRQRWSALSSVALHGLVIAVLLHAPEPIPTPPPEIEVMLELPPPKPRVKQAKTDKQRQKDKKRTAEKRRKPVPHTLEARWERETKPVTAAAVQLPAVMVEAVPVPVAAPAINSTEQAPRATPVAAAISPVPSPLPAVEALPATPVREAEAMASQAPVEKPVVSSADKGDGHELSTPSTAARQALQTGSSGMAMAASERVGAPTSDQASSGSAALSQSAQRASATDVMPDQRLRAADAPTTLQSADNRASAGGGGAALSGQSQRASAAGEAPTDPRALQTAGSGARTVTVAEPPSRKNNTHPDGRASSSPHTTAAATRHGAGAGGAEISGSAMAAAGPKTLALALSDSIPGRAFSWLQERVAGLSVPTPASAPSTEFFQMKLATSLPPRHTQIEAHTVPGKTAGPALQSTATRAGADLPGEGKTLRVATLDIQPSISGRGRNPYLPDRPVNEGGGVSHAGGVESSQAGQRAADHTGQAKAKLVAQVGDSNRSTLAATDEAAMTGVETTAANSICKLPEANSTNLLKAAKGAPRMISQPPMFNPIWVPAGELVLRVQVLANGETGQVLVKESSGFKVLDDEAANQIRSARFQPGERDGQPTEYWVDLPIRYNKPSESK